jgi:hypothetical protein
MSGDLKSRDRVIAATGMRRDVLRRGEVLRLYRHVELVEMRLDDGKVIVWPREFVFREDGGEH